MMKKIIAFTLMVLMTTSAWMSLPAYAEDNQTLPNPVDPTLFTGDGNQTLGDNGTLGDGNMTDDGPPVDPAVLAMIRAQARTRQQEMLRLLADENGTINWEELPPAVANSFTHAEQAMTQAENWANTSNPRAAAQQYLRAMKHWRNMVKKYGDLGDVVDDPDGDTPPANETTTPEGLAEEINATQTQLINRFQEQFRERLHTLYQYYNETSGTLEPGDALKLQKTLSKTEQKLLRIQARINMSDLDVLDDLENATDGMDDDFDDLEDNNTRNMYKTMNKLEAKIQKTTQKRNRKAAQGEDTGEEDAEIEELKGNVDKAKGKDKDNGNNGKGSDKGDDEGSDDGSDEGNGNGNGNGKGKGK